VFNTLPDKKGGDIVCIYMLPTIIFIYNVSYNFWKKHYRCNLFTKQYGYPDWAHEDEKLMFPFKMSS